MLRAGQGTRKMGLGHLAPSIYVISYGPGTVLAQHYNGPSSRKSLPSGNLHFIRGDKISIRIN